MQHFPENVTHGAQGEGLLNLGGFSQYTGRRGLQTHQTHPVHNQNLLHKNIEGFLNEKR